MKNSILAGSRAMWHIVFDVVFFSITALVILGVFIERKKARKKELERIKEWTKSSESLAKLYKYVSEMGVTCHVQSAEEALVYLKREKTGTGWSCTLRYLHPLKSKIFIPLDLIKIKKYFLVQQIEFFAHEIGHIKAALAQKVLGRYPCGRKRNEDCLYNEYWADVYGIEILKEIGFEGHRILREKISNLPFCKKAIRENRCPKIRELELLHGPGFWKEYLALIEKEKTP